MDDFITVMGFFRGCGVGIMAVEECCCVWVVFVAGGRGYPRVRAFRVGLGRGIAHFREGAEGL